MEEVIDPFAVILASYRISFDRSSVLSASDDCGFGMHARTIFAVATFKSQSIIGSVQFWAFWGNW